MARFSSGAIAGIEAGAGADVGFEPSDRSYTSMFGGDGGGGEGFERGSVGRRGLILWGASVVWLVLVWRAVKGY